MVVKFQGWWKRSLEGSIGTRVCKRALWASKDSKWQKEAAKDTGGGKGHQGSDKGCQRGI